MLTSFHEAFMRLMKRIAIPLVRISFFIVYFYFGLLKVLGYSPAEVIVKELWSNTLAFIPFYNFLNFFGCYEMLIGIIFLIPGKERLALYLLIPHMITTFGPVVLLPKFIWKGFMVPSLAGQYIIKNLVIVALGIAVAANIGDFRKKMKADEQLKEE